MNDLVPKYFKKMKLFFRIGYGLFALYFVLSIAMRTGENTYKVLMIGVFIISMACMCIYLYYLGKLAGVFSKSKLIWIGGSFVTAPIGPIVAYFCMSNLVKKKSQLVKEPIEPFASDLSRLAMFQIENYKLDQPIDSIKDFVELSTEEYRIYPKVFVNEKIFKCSDLYFLGFTWELMIGVVEGKIYKINPGIKTTSKKQANDISIKALDYCRSNLGTPSEERSGFFIWDTRDGNVVLQTTEVNDEFGVFLFLTSRSIRNYKRIN